MTSPLFRREHLFYLVQLVLTSLCLAIILKVWRLDIGIPFNYEGDTIFELALAKSIASGGWIWWVSDLGAPFGFDAAAFPQNITASSAVMKFISLFTSNPAVILNLYWLLSCVVTSVVCSYSMRLFGFRWAPVLLVSTMYALLPYALQRNVAHISLTYIFVPVICAYCLRIICGSQNKRIHGAERVVLFISCVFIGLDYVYNAFFSCLFLLCAAVVAAVVKKSVRPAVSVAPFVAIICIFSAINFVPSAVTWTANGVPPNMSYKSAVEADYYGLKIRQIISPAMLERRVNKAGFPLENENRFVRLGVVLAFGYLLSIFYALFTGPHSRNDVRWAAGVLVLFGTFVATIGGLGSIFNLLVAPDIRAYNRIIVFIAFFSAFVLCALLSDMLGSLENRPVLRTRKWARKSASIGLGAGIFLVGVIDQGDAARPLVRRYSADTAQALDEKDLVGKVEERFPNVRQIYQLPETTFPLDAGQNRMKAYDHGRPFVWSRALSWSWPSFSYRAEAWHERIGSLSDPKFLANLALSGFNGLWLDRYGYSEQGLTEVEASLRRQIGSPQLESNSKRYAFFDLSGKAGLISTNQTGPLDGPSPDAPFLGFASGTYQKEAEVDGGGAFRWSQRVSRLLLSNPSSTPRRVRFSTAFRSLPGGKLHISGSGLDMTVDLQSGSGDFSVPLELAARQTAKLNFRFEGNRVPANGDARSMYFQFVNPTLKED
ncbi:hypothetical protein JNB88_32355 [Rhizobium cauense]|uniref:hypothetical protein n=1 Tax=Rhizobium cauense TaxID=1166683 RepID=UPI001C6E4CD2|nr:hypothetical protein [Rhizobium cauense]MBW9118300.1 hypothetical protein [Rhizobium cauense]